MINGRTKGHSFEREIVKKIKHIFPKAIRLLEYQEGFGYDIANTLPYKIQCKCKRKYVSVNTIEEVKNLSETDIPVLITKQDRSDTLVVIKLEHFIKLLEKEKELNETRLQLQKEATITATGNA